ncbi:hypothetical protein E1212_23055 [Jiangella ureilytica]|uniref:Uncharacterized protein n=1 Tax=Jiangella ureilytica TaxID=2530374 RepID=A0A4V2XW42_9ACTN|nr:hypothetical protein [Jiangella ureilytica]TDC47825.1 hypothetical protein E1212_23055 [Jiangella ureilytica]
MTAQVVADWLTTLAADVLRRGPEAVLVPSWPGLPVPLLPHALSRVRAPRADEWALRAIEDRLTRTHTA